MVVFGSLIGRTEPEGVCLDERIGFLGMGFGHQGVPIDVVGLFLAGLEAKEYSILLVDEFLRFNKIPEENIAAGLNRIKTTLEGLKFLYSYEPEILTSSEFMKSREYGDVLKEVKEQIEEAELMDKLLQTVPEKFRKTEDALKYPLNEIACVEFLRRTKDVEVKIGPSKEKDYDEIMLELGLGIDFAYVIDAYAFGTKEPEQVIHYIPTHRGKTNGQRIFLDEPIYTAEAKLLLGPEKASKYLLRLSSVVGYRLGKDYLTQEEINNLHGKKLKKKAKNFVLENILKPYKEIVQNGH
ncbi:hypothetical protein ISS05_05140 [Candidatus Woesearchaeota archaeon]|nr:hypothetical protein [Candidatus Woesearchaeota archaeon]